MLSHFRTKIPYQADQKISSIRKEGVERYLNGSFALLSRKAINTESLQRSYYRTYEITLRLKISEIFYVAEDI